MRRIRPLLPSYTHKLTQVRTYTDSTSSTGALRIRVENSPQICYGKSVRGLRAKNEDRFQRMTIKLGDKAALYAAVFDGYFTQLSKSY